MLVSLLTDDTNNSSVLKLTNGPQRAANRLKKFMRKMGYDISKANADIDRFESILAKIAEDHEELLTSDSDVEISMMELVDLMTLLMENETINVYPTDMGKTFWKSDLPKIVDAKRASEVGDISVGGDIVEQMCNKCKKIQQVILSSVQTRGNDEGTTTFAKCTACNAKWKQ